MAGLVHTMGPCVVDLVNMQQCGNLQNAPSLL